MKGESTGKLSKTPLYERKESGISKSSREGKRSCDHTLTDEGIRKGKEKRESDPSPDNIEKGVAQKPA